MQHPDDHPATGRSNRSAERELPCAAPQHEAEELRRPRAQGEPIRPLIWAGGMSHEVDLRLIKDAVDGRLISIAGYQRAEPWFNMVKMFPGCRVVPAEPVKHYMDVYNGHQVALAPLVASEFAACKSNLKILEAGAKGLPIVCSAVPPYLLDIHKRDAYMPGVDYAINSQDWCRYIARLLATPGFAEDQGARLAEHVRENYHLDDVNVHRRQILEG